MPGMILSADELAGFLGARNAVPHALLGMHPCTQGGHAGVVVRAFLQDAEECGVVDLAASPARVFPMERLDPAGFFEVFIPAAKRFPYQLRATNSNREMRQVFDPYAFAPTLGEQDLYLFNEGTELRLYEKLGAHPRQVGGVRGVAFAVWAPNAVRVSVVGNFNRWDGRFHPMRSLGSSGVWELFIPGLRPGEMYKYEILTASGVLKLKTDPHASFYEGPPNNASIVYDLSRYTWGDAAWMEARRASAGTLDRPFNVYEVHLGSWRRNLAEGGRPLTYREMAPQLADYAVEHGFTHVEFLPVSEFPFDGSWGYQVTGFFAPTHRFGEPDDFRFLVDHLHQRGVGVILDWVPAHFPRDAFALEHFDGTHLYEHEDPRQGAHQDWGTLIFNYGRSEVRCFLTASALAWCERYHIDGLRVDAVASMLYLDYSRKAGEWVPNRHGGNENLEAIAFLKHVNDTVHAQHPGVLMIAEESTSFGGVSKPTSEGGLGFDLKWNMGWMHDTLRFFEKDPVYRKFHYNDLTFGMLYQYAERFQTVFSHDEVVHGKGSMLMKMPAFAIAEKSRHLRSLYAHMWAWPGKKLLFMGGEFGQSAEWNYAGQLDWHLLQYIDHDGIRRLVGDLNRLVIAEPALSRHDFDPRSFRWISCWDVDATVVAYARVDPVAGDVFLVVGNFTPVARHGYRIGVPEAGTWREVINTDSAHYGGGNTGNGGGVVTEPVEADRLPQSLLLALPPASVVILKWIRP
jgi:1,4-alpha-glucan branching enzyme